MQRNSNATALYGWAPSSAASVTVTMERGNAFVVNISATPDAAAAGAWRAPLPVTDADSVPWRLTVQTSGMCITFLSCSLSFHWRVIVLPVPR